MKQEEKQVLPTKQGQIVIIANPLPGDNPNEQYLVAEDPSRYPPERQLQLYSITEILRSKHGGGMPAGKTVAIKDLHVIGDDLKSWVESWNEDFSE